MFLNVNFADIKFACRPKNYFELAFIFTLSLKAVSK